MRCIELSSINGFGKTISDGAIDSVFTEVTHSESLGLRNPTQLRLFHLKVDGTNFTDDGLYKCLRRNIGQYVFSRTRIEKFRSDGDEYSIGLEAMQVISEAQKKNPETFGNMLGEILLYAFFEEKLNAPKIFSKVELNAQQPDSAYDGIHLLELSSISFQMVLGTSYMNDVLEDAVDNAFDKIKKSKSAPLNGIPLVSEMLFERNVDTKLAEQLAGIITPDPSAPSLDTAYGIFLCHSVGLDKSLYDSVTYRMLLETKMVDDIKHALPKIQQLINSNGLSGHSFYIYVVPLDDATADKTIIMNKVTGGVR